MQRLSYPAETVLSHKITSNRIVLSFKDSPIWPLERRLRITIGSNPSVPVCYGTGPRLRELAHTLLVRGHATFGSCCRRARFSPTFCLATSLLSSRGRGFCGADFFAVTTRQFAAHWQWQNRADLRPRAGRPYFIAVTSNIVSLSAHTSASL